MAKQRIQIRLYNVQPGGAGGSPGEVVRATGGFIMVTKPSNAVKAGLTTRTGATQANGFALTSGGAEFYYEDSVDTSVDCFIMTPSGHFIAKYGLVAGIYELPVDLQVRRQMAIIPVAAADYTANVETSTGFVLPRCIVESPNVGMFVATLEASRTLSLGPLSTETGGSATGFLATLSTAAAGQIIATLANGAETLGTLLRVLSTGGSVLVPRPFAVQGTTPNARTIGVTTAASSASFRVYAQIPYTLTSDQPGQNP